MEDIETVDITFSLGWQTISAVGRRIYENRSVFRLHLQYTAFDNFLRHVLAWPLRHLASPRIEYWLLASFPKLILPEKIILKQRPSDPDFHALFLVETEAYVRLKHLQGSMIPKCYGVARCEGMHALVLSEARGEELVKLDLTDMTPVLSAIEPIYTAFSNAGLVHGDPTLHNVLVEWTDSGWRAMMIDFDGAELNESDEEVKRMNGLEYEDLQRRLEMVARIIKGDNVW